MGIDLLGSCIAYHMAQMANPMSKYFPIGLGGSVDDDERPRIFKGRRKRISAMVPMILPKTKKTAESRLTSRTRKLIHVLRVTLTRRPKIAPMENETEWVGAAWGECSLSESWASSSSSSTWSSSISTSGMECRPCSASSSDTLPTLLDMGSGGTDCRGIDDRELDALSVTFSSLSDPPSSSPVLPLLFLLFLLSADMTGRVVNGPPRGSCFFFFLILLLPFPSSDHSSEPSSSEGEG